MKMRSSWPRFLLQEMNDGLMDANALAMRKVFFEGKRFWRNAVRAWKPCVDVAAVVVLAEKSFVAISLVKDSGFDFVQSVRMSSLVTLYHLIGDCCSCLDFATPDSAQ